MITNAFFTIFLCNTRQKSIQSILKKKLFLLKKFLPHWYQKVFTAFVSKSIKIFYKIAQRYCFYKNRSPKILESEKIFLNHFIDEAQRPTTV